MRNIHKENQQNSGAGYRIKKQLEDLRRTFDIYFCNLSVLGISQKYMNGDSPFFSFFKKFKNFQAVKFFFFISILF